MITIIAAMTKDQVIGLDGALPWNIPEELNFFRTQTRGATVIMGRKTLDSIGHALPERNNIVISSRPVDIEGVRVCASLREAIAVANTLGKDIYIIGGGVLYTAALPIAERLMISCIHEDYQGDTYFPVFSEDEWQVSSRSDKGAFELAIYTKKHEETT